VQQNSEHLFFKKAYQGKSGAWKSDLDMLEE